MDFKLVVRINVEFLYLYVYFLLDVFHIPTLCNWDFDEFFFLQCVELEHFTGFFDINFILICRLTLCITRVLYKLLFI